MATKEFILVGIPDCRINGIRYLYRKNPILDIRELALSSKKAAKRIHSNAEWLDFQDCGGEIGIGTKFDQQIASRCLPSLIPNPGAGENGDYECAFHSLPFSFSRILHLGKCCTTVAPHHPAVGVFSSPKFTLLERA